MVLRIIGVISLTGLCSCLAIESAPCASVDGWMNCTLRVEVATVHLSFKNISFRTRTYNGTIPGPVLRVRPGDSVNILLQNRLGENLLNSGCDAPMHTFRAANSTNLHVHGIYEDAEHDNTFACVPPGSDLLYSYRIRHDTGTSTKFYHPHFEGSSSLQLYGGMAGAFEIDDPLQDKTLFVSVSQTLVLQMLNFDPKAKDYIENFMNMNGASTLPLELHNPENYTGILLLTNGKVNAPLSAAAGQHARLKIINAISGSGQSVNLGFLGVNASACQVHVLAYDGVYIAAPRLQSSVFIPSGGRADVSVMCHRPGLYQIGTVLTDVEEYGTVFPHGHVMMTLHLYDAGTKFKELPKVLPGPPPFYSDLSKVRPQAYHTLMFSDSTGTNIVNGWPYNGSISHCAEQHRVQEWSIFGGEGKGLQNQHTYHQHMTHFQITSASLDSNGLVAAVGDWRDTLPLYRDLNFTIRFVPPFTGRMMIHCHVLKHEDLGMMTVVNFTSPTLTLRKSSSIITDVVSFRRGIAAVGLVFLALAMLCIRLGRLRSYKKCKCMGEYHQFQDGPAVGA